MARRRLTPGIAGFQPASVIIILLTPGIAGFQPASVILIFILILILILKLEKAFHMPGKLHINQKVSSRKIP